MNAAFCIKEMIRQQKKKIINAETLRLCGVKDCALGSTDLVCVNYFAP